MVKNSGSPAFKAFVDASAGAMGALFAAILLYPLDVVKTRRQVDVDDSKEEGTQLTEKTKDKMLTLRKKQTHNLLVAVWLIYQHEGVEGIFAGLVSKVAHTVLSNFAYFYCYSFLKTAMEKHSSIPITTGMSLLIASAAGALNMSMTLPLEIINTRAQIFSSHDEASDADDQREGKKTKKHSMWSIAKEIYSENGLMSFWKGFIPSLMLVSNPSINYTIFDKLKLQLQHAKMAASGTKRLSSLTALEAFVLAAIAKAVATIITYPVIRAKVLMQAQKKHAPQEHKSSDPNHHAEMGNSMVQVLMRIGELEGPTGYFKGCSAQLLNTVLKSALLVMTKEEITKYTMSMLYLLRRGADPDVIRAAKA
ncbi:hypothetical protein PsorP6_012096 [Peronosclerospora sorghi]|uniref:Uncharacterized protein n=1 Tax=Peronosclerospora sorghi TaxID=230839 RepID=A0ACC0WL30_9STRA|nr:hypothetical protein PsorP6_012096 [Peronosclerospora sorghi]